MVIIKFAFVLLLIFFHAVDTKALPDFFVLELLKSSFKVKVETKVSHCERRIVGGEQVTSDKSYVVYLVKAQLSEKRYDAWLCGGALVSREFILTSAACVEDVQFMYAIAGYKKYITDKELDHDDCTKQMKKKIVYTCIPVSYEFDYDKIQKWAYIDIALVKVESPYDLNDPDYQLICSYSPSIIPINYDAKRQADNVDALVLGWGHTQFWRQRSDHINYNQEYLRFGATTLYEKSKCKKDYNDYPDLINTIHKYMICSLEPGHLNDHGIPYTMNQMKEVGRTGCITIKQQLMGLKGALCKENHEQEQNGDQMQSSNFRKHMSVKEKSDNVTNHNENGTNIVNGTDYIYKPGYGKISGYYNRKFTRRNGICQNDHGGPLVTWAGKREVLIGVASVFRITENNTCIGPFLYTSTMCNGAFIGCVLGDRRANVLRGHNESVSTRKALLCDSAPSVKGFDTIESYVSWKDHPDGPADNEKDATRNGPGRQKKGRDKYATIVQESDSDVNPLKDEEETNDRFALKLGPPLRRPPLRKRPPVRQRPRKNPPLRNTPQARWDPSSVNRNPPVMQSPAIKTPPSLIRSQMGQSRIVRPLSKLRAPQIIRPIKRYPSLPSPEMKPPPIFGHPLQRVSPENSPLREMEALPENSPQIDMEPRLQNRFHAETNSPPPTTVDDPEFGEILNFQSDESFDGSNLNTKTPTLPASEANPGFLLRPLSPLRL